MKYQQKQIVNYHKYEADFTEEEAAKLLKAVKKSGVNMKYKIIGSFLSFALFVIFVMIVLFIYPAGW